MKEITMKSVSVAKILPLVVANPGKQTAELALLAGYSHTHTKNALAVLRRNGEVASVEVGHRKTVWYTKELGEPLIAAWVPARRRKREKKTPNSKPTLRDRIFAMAATDDDGTSTLKVSALLGCPEKHASVHINKMKHLGRLYPSQRGNCRLRWFDTPERAQAWAELPPVAVTEHKEKHKPGMTPDEVRAARRAQYAEKRPAKAAKPKPTAKPGKDLVSKQKPAVDAGVTLRARFDAAAPDYSRAKVTVCPSATATARWQCAPGSDAYMRQAAKWEQFRSRA